MLSKPGVEYARLIGENLQKKGFGTNVKEGSQDFFIISVDTVKTNAVALEIDAEVSVLTCFLLYVTKITGLKITINL